MAFIIKHALAVLDADFPYLSQIGALRDCDVRDLLMSDIMVPHEYSVYNFIKSWKIYKNNPAPSDKTLQTLMQSCVRWGCMPSTQIQAIAHEGLVNSNWLVPYFLTPHTQPPRVHSRSTQAILRHQSTCHQLHHVKIPVMALYHECTLMFKQFRIKFASRVVDDRIQFVTSWILSEDCLYDHELIYIASEASLVGSGAELRATGSSVVPMGCKVYSTHVLPMSPLVDALVTDKNFLHGENLDCLICQLVILVRPCKVSFFDVAPRLFITDLVLPPHFLISGYAYCVDALSRQWHVYYNPFEAYFSVRVVVSDGATDGVYRIRVLCIEGSTAIANPNPKILDDHLMNEGIWFLFTPPIISSTSIEGFNDRPWGITLRLTIVHECS